MASKATVLKATLQVSDLNRHYYATHQLTIAQHPSETEERIMVRILAFALHASDSLAFTRGLSTEDEPDLWDKDLTGRITCWVDLGQPEEKRIRKACGRADEVFIYSYQPRNGTVWWEKSRDALDRFDNLQVVLLETVAGELVSLCNRQMSLQCMIQDTSVYLSSDQGEVELSLRLLKTPTR